MLELELEDLLELELDIELDELLLELKLLLLLLLLEDKELLLVVSEPLETDEEDGTTACELELLASDDEDTTADEELEGVSSEALLLDTAVELLDTIDELLDEDFTELARDEAGLLPVPGTVPPPPPQAVNAADRERAETIRKE